MNQINNPDLDALVGLYNQLADGKSTKLKVAEAVYDASVAGAGAIGDHLSGVIIPKNAIITKAFVDSLVTATSATDAGTMAVSALAADDLVAAIAISDGSNPWDAGLHAAVPDGAVANMIKMTDAKDITFTIAVEPFTAGKFRVFVEYYMSE